MWLGLSSRKGPGSFSKPSYRCENGCRYEPRSVGGTTTRRLWGARTLSSPIGISLEAWSRTGAPPREALGGCGVAELPRGCATWRVWDPGRVRIGPARLPHQTRSGLAPHGSAGVIGTDPGSTSRLRQVPRGVWALGFVSLFMDISSEMIHALLPVYLVTVLGASTLTVGLIEGVAEATANITKVFSGVISDWIGRRKLLAALGYSLGAATKPIFALASNVGWIMTARFVDRVGKGVRGAPRDALVADLSPPHLRGASFGLRQSLDTVGAFVGPLAAFGLMAQTGDAFQIVFWIAVIPAVVAVALMLFGVEEPPRQSQTKAKPAPRFTDMLRLGGAFWAVVAVSAVLTLARFSEAFLVLRAQDVGLRIALVPLVMAVMNVVYAVSAYPAGELADRIGRRSVLALGILFLLAADVVLALGATIPFTLLGVVLWGLHMGFTQGLFAALVADTAPPELRGSAFGLFNLAVGVAMLAASVVAGALWDAYGPAATFQAGAGFTAVAFLGLLGVWTRLGEASKHPEPLRAAQARVVARRRRG